MSSEAPRYPPARARIRRASAASSPSAGASGGAGRRGFAGPAIRGARCTKASFSTARRPSAPFSRSTITGAIRPISIAAGPVQASVSVPAERRTGSASAARAGPASAGQSARICAASGLFFRKAGRVSLGTSAPSSTVFHCRSGIAGASGTLARAGRMGAPRGFKSFENTPLDLGAPSVLSPAMADAALLLAWYDRHRRRLPWRDEAAPDPYRIWVSEVMLQQTTTAAAAPRYARFLARFPDVQALADAPWEEVSAEWAGLGYYARARNLHAAAKAIAAGGMPRDAAGWRALPGVGAYTAHAVAAIAFGEAAVPVDANVERVLSRLHAITAPLPKARPAIARHADAFMGQAAARARPGDFAQALFDLGATVCTSRRPACALCPWRGACAAFAQGIQDGLPVKPPKAPRPMLHGTHFALLDGAGRIGLVRRPEAGLLGGMLALPGTPWRAEPWDDGEALPHAPITAAWRPVPGVALHGFTHRDLTMRLLRAEVAHLPNAMAALDLPAAEAALPGTMRKLLALLRAAG